MKSLKLVVLSLMILSFFGITSTVFAGSCPTLTIDENGSTTGGLCNGSGLFTSFGVLVADPGPGGLSSVLGYALTGPASVNLVAGDVLLQDGVGGPVLDIVRFNSPSLTGNNAASIVFYSDNVDGFDSLADTTGPPGALYANNLTILETGSEANNGAFYTPTASQPGFVAGFNVTYIFKSDGNGPPTPEPASLLLLGTGLLGVGFARRYFS